VVTKFPAKLPSDEASPMAAKRLIAVHRGHRALYKIWTHHMPGPVYNPLSRIRAYLTSMLRDANLSRWINRP